MFKLDLEKTEEPEIKLPTSIEKARGFQKNIYFCFIDYAKVFDYVDHKKTVEKFFKRWEYQTTLSASWEICMHLKKQQLELYIKQQTGSKLGKEYVKVEYCHPAYLICIRVDLMKCQDGWRTSWNQDCWEKYQ